MIHGFCGSSAVWEAVIPHIDSSWRVFIPDLPGFGSMAGSACHSMRDFTDYLSAYAADKGIEQAVVIGHSMGGYILLDWFTKNPNFFSGLGLIHSVPFADTDEKKQVRERSIEWINQRGKSSYLKSTLPAWFNEALPSFKVSYLMAESIAMRASEEGISSALKAMRDRKDHAHTWLDNALPRLWVLGQKDALIPAEEMVKIGKEHGQIKTVVLPEAAHMGMLESPYAVATALNVWLKNPGNNE